MPVRGTANARILYIEDNRENRMLVRAILEAEGYTIVDAEDGLAGIEAAIREQPDLILLDINLPGVDGYEVASILKSFPNIAPVPVIALTAYAMEGDRQRTLVAGCEGYIQKPIDVDEFPRQVAEFIRGKREHVEEREQGMYLRELNQRLVYRLVNQVEELKRLNQHFVRRAGQLAELHRAVQDITSEVGVADLLGKLLPHLSRALNTTHLSVELVEPAVRVAVAGDAVERPRSVLSGASATEMGEDWIEVEWSLPLSVRGRQVGTMNARHVLPPGAKADEEQLLNIVANQVAIAVENSRLYDRVTHRALEQESLVAAGRLLTGTLQMSEVLGRLAELIRNRLGGVVRIWLREPASGDLSLSAQAGETAVPGDDETAPARALAPYLLEQRTLMIVPDLRADARIKHQGFVAGEGFVTFLGLPLSLEDDVVGILSVLSREPRTFLPEEVAFAEALASSAAAAIRNARSYEETQHQLRTTETVLAVTQAVGSTLELTEVLRRTARAIARAVGADTAAAWLLSKDADDFVPLVGYRIPKDLLEQLQRAQIRTDHPLFGLARQLDKPVYAGDSHTDPRFDHPLLRLLGHKSLVIQPILLKGENIGGFAIAWTRESHEPTADQLRLIEGISRQAAIAVDNARLITAERQAQERQKAFVEIVKELAAEDDFERLFSLIGRRVCELLGADTATMWLLDDDMIELRDWYGLTQPEGIIRRRPIVESLFRRGIEARRAFSSSDMAEDPHWRGSNFTRVGYRAVLDVPIMLRDRVIGVLAVFYRRRRVFSDEDAALLLSLAGHTAVALDRTNLVRELKGRLEESQTLLSVSRAVSSTLDLTEMMRRVARSTAGVLGADMVGAYLADEDMAWLRPIAGYHVPAQLRDAVPLRLRGHKFVEEAWQTHQPVISSNAGEDARVDPEAYARFRHRSMVFIPMIARGEVIGGLCAVWWQHQIGLSREDFRLVEGIARQAAIAIENSRLYEGVKRQMAELKQTQAQLIQSTKLAAIGELAANIAHEINNPLTTVLGFASFLAEKLEPGAPTLEELTLIQEEATRARDIVRDLLQFSRQSDFLPAMSDINVVVEQVMAMVRRQGAVDTVQVHEAYGENLPLVEMDVSRIKQVFLNIINNAIYAMPDGGSLTVRTLAQDGFLHAEFTDTGSGIEPETLPRIFDPFFTTKPDVSGTGLGLSVSLGIIQSHGGTIEVASTLGVGSTFTIKLPLDGKPPRAPAAD